MTEWGVGSSVRRLCAPTGALLALVLVFAASALAAPAPDPPPLPAPPKAEPVQPTVTVVRQVPVVRPAPVVTHSTPVAKAPAQRVKPKPAPARAKVTAKRVAKPKASKPAPVLRPPHDRNRVPLAAFTPSSSPAADSVDRDLLALAGLGLLLVAMGGAVVLFAARRQLALAALGLLCARSGPAYAASPMSSVVVGTAGTNGLAHEQRHGEMDGRRRWAAPERRWLLVGRPLHGGRDIHEHVRRALRTGRCDRHPSDREDRQDGAQRQRRDSRTCT